MPVAVPSLPALSAVQGSEASNIYLPFMGATMVLALVPSLDCVVAMVLICSQQG